MLETPTVIALDTNVLIRLADCDDLAQDCFGTIRERLPGAITYVLPTVIHELADLATDHEDMEIRRLCETALENISEVWRFKPINYIPVGHGIIAEAARKLREDGLLPEEEVNDSLIIAEAAIAGVSVLLSGDSHIRDIDQTSLKLTLDRRDVSTPIIASPWKIVSDFFPK